MVAKRLYIALCISASTTLSINCLYLNKIRGTSRSVEDVDSDDQEEQDQEESSVHLIAKPGDEGVGFIDVSDNTLNETIDSTGYVDDGDDSHATDAFNVSNPPTKTVRNLR